MKRLYTFLAFLFLALLLISFIYGTLVIWLYIKAVLGRMTGVTIAYEIPSAGLLKAGFYLALLYTLVLFVMMIFLLKRSIHYGRRFTITNIITIAGWFFLLTTLVYMLYYLSYSASLSSAAFLSPTTIPDLFPPYLWPPFPIAWLSLFIILHARIKKAA